MLRPTAASTSELPELSECGTADQRTRLDIGLLAVDGLHVDRLPSVNTSRLGRNVLAIQLTLFDHEIMSVGDERIGLPQHEFAWDAVQKKRLEVIDPFTRLLS